jgi:cytochrome P450
MWRLADRQLDEFVRDGACEFIGAYAQPFAMLVVADLLGVPESDHQRFREFFGLSKSPGAVGAGAERDPGENPLSGLDEWFASYVADRRRSPRKDVLTDLSRRFDPGRHIGRAHGDVPVRRRSGDDGASARRRAEAPRRAS